MFSTTMSAESAKMKSVLTVLVLASPVKESFGIKNVDENGYIQAFDPAFIPFYAPIKDDYKNWR